MADRRLEGAGGLHWAIGGYLAELARLQAIKPAAAEFNPAEILELIGRKLGVPDRMLDIPMPEIRCSDLVSCPLFASAKPQACLSMCGCAWKPSSGGLAGALHELGKSGCAEGRASLAA